MQILFYLFAQLCQQTTPQEQMLSQKVKEVSPHQDQHFHVHKNKFMSFEYEEMRSKLNDVVLATSVAYKYYPAENKPPSQWRKLCESVYNPTYGLFSTCKSTFPDNDHNGHCLA